MINYYDKFIKPKEIIKDINHFYNLIKDIICNDLYGQFLYNKRKKIDINEFVIENFLSKSNNTRLNFSNDKIIVKFIISKTDTWPHIENNKITISKLIYKNYKIDDIIINMNIVLSPKEYKNKLIYDDNQFFHELRKNINDINNFYVSKFRKSEEGKYRLIYNKILKIEKTYSDWNRLIKLISDCTDPYFNQDLFKFKDVLKGMKCDKFDIVFKMMHQTQFFQKYYHQRQIKFLKFFKSLKKECLDDNEIIYLSNELAKCFGHTIKDYEESIDFLKNIISHFNNICHIKEIKINTFVYKNGGNKNYL